MCIISLPVKSVGKTKLFVGPDVSGTNQITVYSNNVDNISDLNAMILPVPYPETVRFIDLSGQKDFFDECTKCFRQHVSRSLSSYDGFSLNICNDSMLKVYNVGSYKASIALNIGDLNKVDTSVFKLASDCGALLESEYGNKPFGFIICKLNMGKEDYHPFAYSHKILNSTLFIPTKHYHSHISNTVLRTIQLNQPTQYTSKNINSYSVSDSNNLTITEDWDHEIYLYNCGKKSKDFEKMTNNFKNFEWTKTIPKSLHEKSIDFTFGSAKSFEKILISGPNANIDLIISQ